ncbi:hypothetical protein Q8A67_018657 [Cirrhinus molitorella]|uniref:Uncharacterized protein n=1 Tax=Cirrhinus molitorella TaxID=172907 RepID=A0AA88PGH1_9TELE|nr:hypothetical protein Q8A67_018657 [Cirrhinus molitorella]
MRKGLSSKAERTRPSSELARRPEESYLTLPNSKSPLGTMAATDLTSKSNPSFSGHRNKKNKKETACELQVMEYSTFCSPYLTPPQRKEDPSTLHLTLTPDLCLQHG